GELGLAGDDADAALPWLERALALARREELKAAEAIGVYSLAVVRWILGDLAGAERDVARSIELFGALVGSARRILCPVHIAEARRALEEALELRRRQGDRRGVGLVLTGLALVDTAAGNHARAERHLARARELFRRAGDRWGLASALWRTADLAFARDRPDDA